MPGQVQMCGNDNRVMTGPWALTLMGSYESQEAQETGSEFYLQDLLLDPLEHP